MFCKFQVIFLHFGDGIVGEQLKNLGENSSFRRKLEIYRFFRTIKQHQIEKP